ncbi:uncharacterized protein LOC101863874 [Aplysia californica]|uniref:RBR-type E3 ubiquitin transferase n=1 Tax=Aplysia californica TaxID=6500 RepID=A0ABM0JDW2_APLCA|nr:uncharacterized protein LOC101863874 [Aplysia californica]
MVYKVCKGGVRSGNTLRGLHTLNSYRYGRHACLIGSSSMTSRDVAKMVTSSTDDAMVTETVQNTDVILSLNKKQRWKLPATMHHMIRTGCFDRGAMVSVLERHKLKRRANCVSFISNKGKVTSVQPTQKRYFSFKLDNIDEEQSNRQKKRQLRKAKIPTTEPREIKDKRSFWKTVQVFTKAGETPKNEDVNNILSSTKPEYRMEIFYPCPKTCSLAFNPKYTDVMIDVNEEGKQEIKAVKSPGSKKPRRRHRKRLTTSTWVKLGMEEVEEDLNQMWDEVYQEDCSPIVGSGVTADEKAETKTDISEAQNFDVRSKHNGNNIENLWSSLIAQAEKARELCTQRADSPQKRPVRRPPATSFDKEELKPHLKALPDGNEFRPPPMWPILRRRWRNKARQPVKKPRVRRKPVKQQPVEQQPEEQTETKRIPECVDLLSFRIIASSKETCLEDLQNKFGHLYAEAECQPRTFVINVSDDVKNIFKSSRTESKNSAFISYLVFTYEGPYDDGLDSYKVAFNSNVCKNTEHMQKNIPFLTFSIDDVINQVLEILLGKKSDNLLKFTKRSFESDNTHDLFRFIYEKLQVKVESFYPSQEINKLRFTELEQNIDLFSMTLSQLGSSGEDFDIFCQICYESVTPSHVDSLPGTALTKCGHVFCNNCWKTHIRTRLTDGAVKILCPGYDCDVTVGPVTLLSLVHVSEVAQLLQRQKEDEVETSEDSKWCPNPICGRVIKTEAKAITPDMSYDVRCACGFRVCFACLGSAHWPAHCEQADEYTGRLYDISLPKEMEDDPTEITPSPVQPKPKEKPGAMRIEGRLCPRCLRFIEKKGGCPHMYCKCGHQFCWTCLASADNHIVCKPDFAYLYKMTRTLLVRHVPRQAMVQPLGVGATPEEPRRTCGGRSRFSMYQRALQQRLEGNHHLSTMKIKALAHAIATAASKDDELKTEFLALLDVDQNSSTGDDESVFSTTKHVTRFLHSCRASRSALHHVAEFTFVLVHDVPQSADRRRALALANDISGYSSFIRSILEGGVPQQPLTVVKRLLDIQMWIRRAVGALLKTANKLKAS